MSRALLMCSVLIMAIGSPARSNAPIGDSKFTSSVPPFGGFPGPLPPDTIKIYRDPSATKARLLVPQSLLPKAAATQSGARPPSGLFGGLGVCVMCGGLVSAGYRKLRLLAAVALLAALAICFPVAVNGQMPRKNVIGLSPAGPVCEEITVSVTAFDHVMLILPPFALIPNSSEAARSR